MANKILSITFEVDAQRFEDGHFTVPRNVAKELGLKSDQMIHLLIEDQSSGVKLFEGERKLTSGTEISGLKGVKRGQRIKVVASKPLAT